MNSIKFKFMKTTKLMRSVLCATVLVAFGLVGCEQLEPYSINAPADLQNTIDSIANSKPDTGDTTYITIQTPIVGAEDNSAAWWTSFSDYFTVPTNKLLHIEFENYGTGVNTWNNWNLCLSTAAERGATGYSEYFVLRSDAFGWGNSDWNLNLVENNYIDVFPEIDKPTEDWSNWRANMQGAYVSIDVDHSSTGNVFVTATAVGTDGTTVTETYTQPVSATNDINSFLICDGSHFVMKKAYLIPSKVTEIEDVNPVSISVTGTPASVEIGNNDFWGKGVATVTYADGSSEVVDTADVTFSVIPDMTTVGTKTVVLAYSKTKQGAYSKAVSTYYSLEVTNPIVSISANNINYYYYNSEDITFKPVGIVVTALYSDGSTAILDNNTVQFTYPSKIASTVGSQKVDIKYQGPSKDFTTTSTVTLVKGLGQVGASDFSTLWWTTFSNDYTVASGSSKTFTMYCYSDNLANYHSPSTILRKADMTEYAVVRMDNWGWGNGFGTATKTSDWNWDIFTTNIHGSKVVITVTNNGNNTADILYNVTYATGETHFQKYAGITVDSSDLNCALVLEKSYLVITE